jgi:hypothetical protein
MNHLVAANSSPVGMMLSESSECRRFRMRKRRTVMRLSSSAAAFIIGSEPDEHHPKVIQRGLLKLFSATIP